MSTRCKICEKNDDNQLIILPFCGFGVCYEHIENLAKNFKCPVCLDHTIDKKKVFNNEN